MKANAAIPKRARRQLSRVLWAVCQEQSPGHAIYLAAHFREAEWDKVRELATWRCYARHADALRDLATACEPLEIQDRA